MTASNPAARLIRDWLKTVMVVYVPIVTVVTFILARSIEAADLIFSVKLPEFWESGLQHINSISTTFLLCEILVYLVLERSEFLHPLEQIVSTVTANAKKLSDVIADADTLDKLLDRKQAQLLEQIKEPTSIKVYKTPQEAYENIPKVINLINSTTKGEKKMMHALLHLSAPGGATDTPIMPPSPLTESQAAFDAEMGRCIQSGGPDRWFVQQIYNVTTIKRLDIIVARMNRGVDGYEVRATSIPDMFPCFSPLILGDQDATLAIADLANYRIGSAMHLHGRDAVKFLERYFGLLWDYGGMFRLRSEQGIDWEEVQRLRHTIESRSKSGGHKKT